MYPDAGPSRPASYPAKPLAATPGRSPRSGPSRWDELERDRDRDRDRDAYSATTRPYPIPPWSSRPPPRQPVRPYLGIASQPRSFSPSPPRRLYDREWERDRDRERARDRERDRERDWERDRDRSYDVRDRLALDPGWRSGVGAAGDLDNQPPRRPVGFSSAPSRAPDREGWSREDRRWVGDRRDDRDRYEPPPRGPPPRPIASPMPHRYPSERPRSPPSAPRGPRPVTAQPPASIYPSRIPPGPKPQGPPVRDDRDREFGPRRTSGPNGLSGINLATAQSLSAQPSPTHSKFSPTTAYIPRAPSSASGSNSPIDPRHTRDLGRPQSLPPRATAPSLLPIKTETEPRPVPESQDLEEGEVVSPVQTTRNPSWDYPEQRRRAWTPPRDRDREHWEREREREREWLRERDRGRERDRDLERRRPSPVLSSWANKRRTDERGEDGELRSSQAEITTEKQIEELKWEPGRTDLPTTPSVPPPSSLPDAGERMRDGTPVKEEKEASPVEQPAVNPVHVTATKTEDPVSSVQLPIDISNDPTMKSPVIEAVDAQANGILQKTIITDIIMTSPVTEDIAMNPVSPFGPPPLDTGSEVPIQKQTSLISDAVPRSQITSPSLLIAEKVLDSVDVNMAEEPESTQPFSLKQTDTVSQPSPRSTIAERRSVELPPNIPLNRKESFPRKDSVPSGQSTDVENDAERRTAASESGTPMLEDGEDEDELGAEETRELNLVASVKVAQAKHVPLQEFPILAWNMAAAPEESSRVMVVDDEGRERMLEEFIRPLKREEATRAKFVRFAVAREKVKLDNTVTQLKDSYLSINKKWKDQCSFLDELMKQRGPPPPELYAMPGAIHPVVTPGAVAPTTPAIEEIFNSRSNRRRGLGGDIVATDAEFEEILAGLADNALKDPNLRASKTAAVIPDMIVGPERNLQYNNDNDLVTDPLSFYDNVGVAEPIWTTEERAIFIKRYLAYPKQFGRIADGIPNKTAGECVLYYYRTKKEMDYKGMLAHKRGGGKRKLALKKGAKSSALMQDLTRAKPTVSKDDTAAATPAKGREQPVMLPPGGKRGRGEGGGPGRKKRISQVAIPQTPTPQNEEEEEGHADSASTSRANSEAPSVSSGKAKMRMTVKTAKRPRFSSIPELSTPAQNPPVQLDTTVSTPATEISEHYSLTNPAELAAAALASLADAATSAAQAELLPPVRRAGKRRKIAGEPGPIIDPNAPPATAVTGGPGAPEKEKPARRSATNSYWSVEERRKVKELVVLHGMDAKMIAAQLKGKSERQVGNFLEGHRTELEALEGSPVRPISRAGGMRISALLNDEPPAEASAQGELGVVPDSIDTASDVTIDERELDVVTEPSPRSLPAGSGPSGGYQPYEQRRDERYSNHTSQSPSLPHVSYSPNAWNGTRPEVPSVHGQTPSMSAPALAHRASWESRPSPGHIYTSSTTRFETLPPIRSQPATYDLSCVAHGHTDPLTSHGHDREQSHQQQQPQTHDGSQREWDDRKYENAEGLQSTTLPPLRNMEHEEPVQGGAGDGVTDDRNGDQER
ncbi:hypothetical protein I314_02304 [Cryptococcus bacillisporus CA1873]|uniref:SANT domain-containing protein n=1 Tax=Cryptococcus bacillisporus CA1873 TaxID=1296111 RepID=A0ABR5BD35_CRYGA|nr:hypothetical protein I314_02304 [Cryptococcus bacillisporus CA1873]|eukprot:KIR67091.1 hypothetical protein I314_02304 [Cryptococcus gattii CA1873]